MTYIIMVLILDGNSELVARAYRILMFSEKENKILASSRSIKKCLKHIKITEIAPYVRTYFRVTI